MRKPTRFEWDPAKAESNFRKHGIPLRAGPDVFEDEDRVDFSDERFDYGEARRNVTGIVDRVVITVTYAMRDGETARIISVRPASRKERKRYAQGKDQGR